jgi:hypothetical protein
MAAIMAVLCAASLLSSVSISITAEAAVPKPKKLTLNAARALAVENSTDYESAEINLESKKAAYESAVKAVTLKEKSMKQFRWSPLLNFKFPQEPNLAEASEFKFKPVAKQYEISVAEHKYQDMIFEINEKVNTLYCNIVVLQETIAFNETRLEATKDGLAKNEAKLRLGQANKSDVEKLEKKVESLTNKVASDRRSLEADLKKLSDMVGFDVSTGYTFEKPFVEATIERSHLEPLIKYTSDRDQTYYEACINEFTCRAELTTNSSLMKQHYGSEYGMISSYVSNALNGSTVNKKAFSKDYKAFLTQIDSHWQGKKKIFWFLKLPKIWFKGDLDGTRYIEDDPTVLQQNVLDYSQALTDKRAAKEDLDNSVTDAFNNYISVRNSYKQYIKDVDDADQELTKAALLNRKGELTFDEYNSQMDSYEELQNSMLDAMKLYTTTLYSFDRLTCGGISAILSGTDADMHTAVVGESYIEENIADGAYYTLESIVQGTEFELTLHIPDDFEVDLTDYELWVNGVQIGERTNVDKKLRHLALSFDTVTEAIIRVYNGDEFVHDVTIDPTVESGPLPIRTGFEIKRDLPGQIGTYLIERNETTGLVELSFEMNSEASDVTSFKVKTEDGKVLGKDEATDIENSLKYVELLTQSLDELIIEFYDESESLVETARFDTANGAVIRKEEE